VEAIDRINRYAVSDQQAFEEDELLQTWVVHHIGIIGEAARRISDDLRAQHPDVPWSQMIGMRNILVHHYFGIDAELVWATVKRDLPLLRNQLQSILRQPTEA
jgi:uncharacterized protein with HEPN domain